MNPKWSYFAIYLFYPRYNTDWIANTEIVFDPNNSVIKRLRCICYFTFVDKPTKCFTNLVKDTSDSFSYSLHLLNMYTESSLL